MAATMRHPFELAQGVSCLDRISKGRAELGLGAGWLVAEHEKNGLALGSPGERVSRLVEVASICRQLFVNRGCIEFSGKFFKVFSDAPWPTTPHVPEIMVGAHGMRLIEKVSPYIDRLDLIESMVDSRPCFVGEFSNDIKNLRHKIEVHYFTAERKTKVSATLNLKIVEDKTSLKIAQGELASAANCKVSDIERDHLRIIDNEAKVFEKLKALAEIGIDRLHIRPSDEYTKEWLNESVLKIQRI
jgi:alkanesulfonate monooxygenase SsuD/methylene tetrahydromethanopterin reductase-like flavin-dependent oxidoreductase (luciferase family)